MAAVDRRQAMTDGFGIGFSRTPSHRRFCTILSVALSYLLLLIHSQRGELGTSLVLKSFGTGYVHTIQLHELTRRAHHANRYADRNR